jgi:predicted component of type VI protein secretion system
MTEDTSPVGGGCAEHSQGEPVAPRNDPQAATVPSVGQRVVAVIALAISAAVLLACLIVGVGVWVVKPRVTAKATTLFGRVDSALNVAEENLDLVQASLGRAAQRLDDAREEQRKLAQEPPPNSALTRVVARSVLPRVAPDLGTAQEKLHNVAEAAVVVNSVLEDVGNFPLLSATGLDLDRLTEMNSRLADVGPAAWELSRLLGEQDDSDAASGQASRIEQTLQTVQASIAEYEPRLADVRQRTEALQARTTGWITPAAIIISLACLWIALSQVSVMSHARRWWGRSAGNKAAVPASQASAVAVT